MNDDLISRSALIAAYDEAHKGPPGGARKLMEEAPAVDAVPVVRCKDCEYQRWCKSAQYLGDDGFCSYGERKENETDKC